MSSDSIASVQKEVSLQIPQSQYYYMSLLHVEAVSCVIIRLQLYVQVNNIDNFNSHLSENILPHRF
jgi:hypothetical protein